MVASSPLTSPDVWNDLHLFYNETLVPRFATAARRGIELVEPSGHDDVIDVGCGPGTLTLLLAPIVKQVAAVDFAEKMIELLKQKCDKFNVSNVDARVADGTALPYPNERFDAALSCFGLFLFADRAKGLEEMYRVLKPGGKVMISSWAPADGPIEGMYNIVREILPGLPFQKGVAPLGTEQEIHHELSQAGFRDVRVEPVPVLFDYETAEEFWRENSRASAPLVATRRKVGEADWPAVEAKLLFCLRQTFRGAVRFHRTALVAVAVRHSH